VVQQIADRIAVLHQGRVVEEGTTDEVLRTPRNSYTRALLDAVPNPDPRQARRRQPV
jgi:ABC-type oligopeptide transport system ATPase subunit